MLTKLKNYVPSKVCLSCDGCCRFKEADSVWRPKVAASEINDTSPGLAEEIFGRAAGASSSAYLPTVSCGEFAACKFFNTRDHTCGIYARRPFECRLYPFVLGRSGERATLSVHHSCPFIGETCRSEDFRKYVSYLETYFAQPAVLDFLRRNPDLIGDYSAYRDELEELFVISL